MWNSKSNEVPLQNPRHNQSKDSTRDLTAAWATSSQTKAALRHIENKLEIAPSSTAVFDSVMDAKKPSASSSRKISRKASRSSSQNKSGKEKSSRSPLRATTLESNVKKSNRVEFREPLASYSSVQLETKQLLSSLDFSGAEGKTEVTGPTIHDREERDLRSRDFESPCSSAADETVVRYLNDRPAIDALQNNEAFLKVASLPRLEEEKNNGSRGDESSTKTLQSNTSQESELKVSSPSATSTSSAHRLEILKRRQHDVKLEKLKERIRKQWEHSEELDGRGQRLGCAEQPVVITNVENAVTPKVRKVAAAPAAPSYRGFNPAETKIRASDGKIWHEEEFHISRDLYRNIALQLTEDSTVKGKPCERNREKKATRPVRKVQKLTRLASPESKQGGNHVISASSWREGQKLVQKILGPAPRIELDRRAVSSDRTGRERAAKSGCIGRTGSDSRLDVTHKTSSRSSERSRSKVRSENNLKKLEAALPGDNQDDHGSVNKDFLPMEIRGILDDLQLDSMSTKQEKDAEKQSQKSVLPTQNARSHSPTKRKPDKIATSEEPQVISKKRHYDTDEVRQYIIRQQEERKKKQNEEKKAQKEATEQKNKRLQELYRKQKEVFTKVKNVPLPEPSAAKRLQETYSKLLLERTLLEEPPQLPTVQETQTRPGYQPSGESDKENKAQERPPSASSSSDMSLSEPQQPLLRSDLMEPPWVQPDRLSPRVQLSHSQALVGSNGGPCFQHRSLEQMDLLSKECDAMLAGRRSHATPVGSLTLMPQPYLNSPSAQQNLLVKPTTNQYKSKLDRIEALKATAASLSSRIESEAKKLAGAGINYGTMWNSDHEFMQENQDDGRWAKAVSPPVREENKDAFSARIQKMLGACVSHTAFDDNLPGVGNLSEFKKLPETIRPHTAAVSLGMKSPAANRHEGILGHLFKRQTDSPGHENQACAPNKAAVPHESSIDSISEGPLLSDGSLCEEEGAQHKQLPLKMLETLKEKDFCMRERNAFQTINEFQKEAEKYLPLFTQTSGAHNKGPWEELAKGSPHSVINIFAKGYQLHGKVFDERSNGGSALLRPLLPAMSPPESVASYEDDFASSQGSSTLTDKKIAHDLSVAGSSNSSIQEEILSRKSSHEPRSAELASQHSSGPRSAASSRSSASSKKRGKKERLDSFNGSSHRFRVEEDKLEWGSQQTKKSLSSSKTSSKDHEQNPDTDNTLENLSGHSLMSFSDKGRSQKTPASSPSSGSQKMLQFDSLSNASERVKSPAGFSGSTTSGLKPNVAFPDLGSSRSIAGAASASGCLRFTPTGLQHRFSAELNYLSAIEESVRQLSDIERIRGVSLAQQESVSLAQILKAQQQRHERDLALLKMKAEQEALESQRQLDEARQKAAQVHAESLQHLVQSRQEVVQETPCKAAAKQTEAALLTTDAAHQKREMTELARSQLLDTGSTPAAPVTSLFDHQRQHQSEFMKQLRARTDTNRKESAAMSQGKEETGDSKQTYSPVFDSYSESSRSKVHDQSSTSSRQESPSVPSSKENEKKASRREKITSSIEEQAHTAVDDSLPSDSVLSLPDEKDSASVATEYSLKFDESMTEDEIEEKSFRSLLPSESHRRNNLEKKRGSRDDSDEEVSPEKTALSSIKELSMPFSGGQDSFSKFTMEMVRQYMKEEEMRAAHQSSLLRLREKALKEKTRAELAWLEHQRRHLRDKGEDDKMPPIRKRQRGLLLRLQQEKAEIKRLQEANKAARKERQLILKQQAEIERIRQTTMKLQEKLKSAGENKLELHSEDDMKQSNGSSPLPTDAETRSPSPISISSSETSSIMQKLKKMRSRMDEKFLTKREQKLMQRRQHAEELLEWKRRLDAEEAEIRRIEKQALAAWDKELLKTKIAKKDLEDQRIEPKETASEEESPVPSCSHLNTETSIPEDLGSLPAESVPSEAMGHGQPESPNHSTTNEEMVYSEEFKSSTSPGKLSPPKSNVSVSKQDSSKGNHRTGGQLRSPVKSHQISHNWSDESLSMTQSETTSDQSDIEGRIRALKDELRKRKSVVYQLKKEQKKRQKERLKAQEASLIKQLESYDEFIKKTEAELSQDLEAAPTAKPQIKAPSSAAAEKPKIKAPPLHRPETAKNWKSLAESERSRASLESISEHADAVSSRTERSVSVHTKKVAVTDVHAGEPSGASSGLMSPRTSRAGSGDSLENVPSSCLLNDVKDISRISHESMNNVVKASNDETAFSHKSDIQEDLENRKFEEYEIEGSHIKPLESSDVLLTLDKEQESSLDILSKKVLHSENEHSQKELFGLAVESHRSIEEMLEQRLSDKNAITGPNLDEHFHQLSRSAEEKGCLLSEQLLSQKELSYLEDFEGSSSQKQTSVEGTLPEERYEDDFEASLLSPNADAQSLAEQSQHTLTSRSRSTSLGSDGEISECLSDRSLSLSGSMHSERLLDLKSPTELIKGTECRYVEQEQASARSPLWASALIAEETDSLTDFNIGDRVLVSKVQPGTLRFKGLTKFAKGFWAGVELDKSEGNNNGTYDGIKYFDCKEKHGIFAPPEKISHITESTDSHLDTNKDEDSFFDDRLEKQHKAEDKDRESSKPGKEDESHSRGATESYSQGKAPTDTAISEASAEERIDEKSSSKANSIKISAITESLAQKHSVVDYLKHAVKEAASFASVISGTEDEISAVQLDDISDFLSEKLERQKTLGEECAEKLDDLSPEVVEKAATPLLDLLTKEKNQLEAQLRVPLREEEESKDQLEKVSLLADSLLRDFVKDTVNQLQQIKKIKDEKIQLSNQELCDVKEESSTPSQQVEKQIPNRLNNFFLSSDLEDEREELSSPDMCPRPESPVFGASGQEELAKRLAELELNREFLSVLGDDQDWFDEDYGLSSHKVQQKQAEEPAVLPKVEPQKVPTKPCEEPLAVPHTAVEVEGMVHAAAEELWKLKELGRDLQSFSLHTDLITLKEQDTDTINKQVYKKVIFDLTREIFGEIFAEDPNLNQPVWMKPCRITSAYFRRVKDPNDLGEIKSFIAAEVLKLFSLRKDPNHKTDWQKMMKFGRKKRDRVDHILVQELHEEEAQWVNYDEDELCVKMQLADGIFEALIRDTVDVLNQINEKQRRLLLV
ncbi:centrosome-associated protein 350 isoform X2 [Colius striatus]|uniref:centrosome-associated protein 350 isoform X2 n=1 Tax=Colius striatus TaxID=57412 RepID=UPI002B1D5177|nr:centrosome-associated protein 350 isoform X2 [Colius striatus]